MRLVGWESTYMHRFGSSSLLPYLFASKSCIHPPAHNTNSAPFFSREKICRHFGLFPVPGLMSESICLLFLLSLFIQPGGHSGVKTRTPFQRLTRIMSGSAGSVMVDEQHVQQIELLSGIPDSYGGVCVEIKNPMDSNAFGNLLRASISQWRQKGTRGVWIKLPIQHVNLVEAAVKEGFWYHHAEPDYLMLVQWLPNTAHSLPANASHRVGIAAFVINSKGEVLVVQEKNGSFKGTGVWKLPTGVVNEGEDICTAAMREVEEETRIKTEFVEVLAFRQSHKSFFTKSDLMFVCMLRPLSSEIQKQDEEIEMAQWMPIGEYAAQPFVKKNPIFDSVANVCLAKKDNNYTGFSTLATTTSSGKTSTLYFNSQDLKQPLSSGDQA